MFINTFIKVTDCDSMIYIASDHAGFNLKEKVKVWLSKNHHVVQDLGTFSLESVDYPDYAKKVCRAMRRQDDRGILICGTGTGMCIAANRRRGIRAAVAYDTFSAVMARRHNNANVLCLRARHPPANAFMLIRKFLDTKFEGGRHLRRVQKLDFL